MIWFKAFFDCLSMKYTIISPHHNWFMRNSSVKITALNFFYKLEILLIYFERRSQYTIFFYIVWWFRYLIDWDQYWVMLINPFSFLIIFTLSLSAASTLNETLISDLPVFSKCLVKLSGPILFTFMNMQNTLIIL